MSDEPSLAAGLPDGLQLPPGFVLPENVSEMEIIDTDADAEYDLMLRDLPDVTLTDVLRHGSRVISVDVEQEIVLYQLDTDTSFVLNPTSAIAWRCLDGESQVGEILVDIADAFGVPSQQVEDDFLPILAAWLLDDLAEEVQHG